jgi:hypothetical protein
MFKPGDIVKVILPPKVTKRHPDLHNHLAVVIKPGKRGEKLDVWWVQLSNGKFRNFEEKNLLLIDDKSQDFTLSETVEMFFLSESSQKHPPGYKAPQGSERDKGLDQTQKDLKKAKQLRKDGKTKQAKDLEQKAYRRRERMEKKEKEKPGFKNKPRPDTKKESKVSETNESELFELIEEVLQDDDLHEELSKKTKATLRKKAKERGFTPSSVEAEYKKGLAAWASSGSRPGMTQHQWAMARVNAATPSKKWATVKKSKSKKESINRSISEAMQTSPPLGYVVEIVGDYSRIKIYIKRTKKPTAHSRQRRFLGSMIIGRSDFSPEDGGIAWEVQDVDAERGYGPLLYDIAMEMVHILDDAGIMPSMTSVSREARAVWKKYHDVRNDVTKTRLNDDIFVGVLEERPDFMRYVYSKNDTPFIDLLREKDLLVSEDFDLD